MSGKLLRYLYRSSFAIGNVVAASKAKPLGMAIAKLRLTLPSIRNIRLHIFLFASWREKC